MLQRLKSIFRPPPVSKLGKLLADYPAFHIPYPGEGEAITDAQAQANLDALLAQRQERLEIIGQLLHEFDIDTAAAFGEEVPLRFFDALDTWSDEHFATIPNAKILADRGRWEASDYSGPEIAYSFLGDVAILLSEIMIHLRPGLKWIIDFSIRNYDDSDAYHRPVVHGLAIPDNPTCPAIIYNHRQVFGVFKNLVRIPINPPGALTRSVRGELDYYPMLPGGH